MSIVVFLVIAGLLTSAAALQDPPPGVEVDNHLPTDTPTHVPTDIIKQMLLKRCTHHYSLACLKLDLARMVDRLSGSSASFQLLPGISLASHNVTPSEDFPQELVQALARDKGTHFLDDFLVSKLSHYLGSLTLSVRLAEASRAAVPETEEGRRRKNGLGGLMTAGLFSGGTLMALGMSALAALAGKALMTALLSLMLSGMAALRGGGGSGGGGKTTYEIITKPVVSHEHSHSSEVQHGGHHHAYAYARSMSFTPVVPAGDLGKNDTQDSYTLAYHAQIPQTEQSFSSEKKEK